MRSKYLLAILVPFLALIPFIATTVSGQSGVQPRITQPIDNTKLTAMRGNVHPMARAEFDRGAAPSSLPMDHMLLVLRHSADQSSAIEALLAQQQDPSSPNYHKWLTPEEFGEQFGPSDADIQKITAWLQSEGFQVNEVSKGRTTIDFSGTAGQLQQALHTTIHSYVFANGEQHWANATDPQIPSALTPVVVGVNSLNNFARKPMSHSLGTFRRSQADGKVTRVSPQFTFAGGCNGGGTTNCYAVGPADFATIYNVPQTINGVTPGTGQTIAIVSDSDINTADVTTFRSLFGLPTATVASNNVPPCPFTTPCVNVIETGTDPGIQPAGDEIEAVLDVQWAGAVAPGAQIDLVVSPSTNTTFGGDTSAQYIVSHNLAPIMSYSYGACELDLGTSGNAFYQSLWSQAATQGITVLVSTGDNGSAGCEAPNQLNTSVPQPATTGLAVNGVASTPFNIAVGGTDFNDAANPTTYWTNVSGTLSSAMGYIPEIAYNDSCTNAILATTLFGSFSSVAETNCNNPQLLNFFGAGINLIAPFGGSGGASNCTTNSTTSTTLGPVSSCSGGYAKPSWQVGPGVPADGKRDLPDVSLFSGDGFIQNFYVVCESDQNVGSVACNLNSPFQDFLGVGGTSVAAQAFAGIMALVDQKTGARQGNANPTLYALAAEQSAASCNSTNSPASTCVFYDTTSGTIAMPCAKGSPNCTVNNSADTIGVLSGYSAGTGYDLATGLGSVNVSNLLNKFGPNFYVTPSATSLTVSSSTPGTMTFTLTSVNGFSGAVSLACSTLPAGTACAFNPASLSVTANSTATSTLTVTKTSSGILSPLSHRNGPGAMPLSKILIFVALMGSLFAFRPLRQRNAILAVVAFTFAIVAVGCSGGSFGSTPVPSSGSGSTTTTSNATVTATSSSNSFPVSFTITVQ